MISYPARIAACAMLGFVLLAGMAGAQTPVAAPTPMPGTTPNVAATPTAAPTPIAFTAHAHADVTVSTANGSYSGTARLGLARRANLTRIDVLSVKSDSFPVPPITATIVIDHAASTITAWSDATKLYHVQPFITVPSPRPTPRPNATPAPQRRGTSPLAGLDVFEMTMKLTGHTTTLGFPSTGLSFDLQVRGRRSAASSHVTATTQLADEFVFFPLTLDVSLEPGAAPYGAKMAYAVDDIARVAPSSSFAVPAGYRSVPSLANVFFPPR